MPTKHHLYCRVAGVFLACLLAACAEVKPAATAAFSPVQMGEVDNAIRAAITQKKLPSAVYHLERAGRVYEKAYGRFGYEENVAEIETSTLFDVASLTKVIATTPSVMILVQEGKLSLDAHLIDFFPECANGGKEAITLRQLLTHVSGLPAGIPGNPPWSGEATALNLACQQTVTDPPGTRFRYSDVNFILLGLIVNKVSGQSLADFAKQRIYLPLGMKDTTFLPRAGTPPHYTWADLAPTQVITAEGLKNGLHKDLEAGAVLRGTVHDPTARMMGGVAGSAGLFSTAHDLARYARMLLNGGELNGVRVLSPESVRLMTTVQTPDTVRERRAIGFDIDSPFSRSRGSVYPLGSYGHTGFTGCALWIDPYSKSFYVFLSNRVYPQDGAGIVSLYAELATLSAKAVASTDGIDFAHVPGALAPRPLTAVQVVSGANEQGGATEQWRGILKSRLSEAQYKAVAGLVKPLATEETAWADLVRARAAGWPAETPVLASVFPGLALPERVSLVIGNRGAEDAFTVDADSMGFDLSALQRIYGNAAQTENAERLDRFFRHEFAHVLQKRWRMTHPWDAQTPLQKALLDIWLEGLGNYYSLPAAWRPEDGKLPEAAMAALTPLETAFASRFVALACATPAASGPLLVGISSGPFERKWGALPAALWLASEPGPRDSALRRFVSAGPEGIWDLAARHLPASLAAEVKDAREAAGRCPAH